MTSRDDPITHSDPGLGPAPAAVPGASPAVPRSADGGSALALGLPDQVHDQIERLGSVEIAVGVLTYDNAETIERLAKTIILGLEKHFPGTAAAFVNADAGSSDGTPGLLAGAGLPTVSVQYDAPTRERVAVPFHGIPGRGTGLRHTLSIAHRLGARVLILLEADLTSMTDQWIRLLGGPVLEKGADLVSPAYARHRYDSTITTLMMRPLVRALFGRRLHRPFGGQEALSGGLITHLLTRPDGTGIGREIGDLWIVATAIADGFSIWESWLGPRTVRSGTRTTDLPTMVAQTLGTAFTLIDRQADLWLETRGSEPLPAVGVPTLPTATPIEVDVERMVEAFRLGLRDLTSIWEQILAPDTMNDVLGLDPPDASRFRFPEDLWARVVYDFALGHHYHVVHREHLLRSLVPLYLGRTAAFVVATLGQSAEATDAVTEAVGAAFERQKPYLVEHWR